MDNLDNLDNLAAPSLASLAMCKAHQLAKSYKISFSQALMLSWCWARKEHKLIVAKTYKIVSYSVWSALDYKTQVKLWAISAYLDRKMPYYV